MGETVLESKQPLLSLEELQEEELAILLEFDAFCSSRGLRYSLQAGTLLGAIRHKGFIPWDDDVDVSMPRPDYDRLLIEADCLPAPLALANNKNSDFSLPFSKVVNREIYAQEPSYEGVFKEHLWIDVFPIDGVPGSRRGQVRLMRQMNWLISRRAALSLNQVGVRQSGWKRAMKEVYRCVARPFENESRIDGKIDALARGVPYESAERVASILAGGYTGWSLPRCAYEDFVEVEFEGYRFPAMGCWTEYLTKCYGNYLELPPENERRTHHLKAWRIQDGG